MEPPLIHVGKRIDHTVAIHAHRGIKHRRVIAADRAIQRSGDHHHKAGNPPIELVVGERVALIDIGNLIGAHAKIREDHQKRARHKRHREHARRRRTQQLRCNDREQRKHNAPEPDANRVPDEILRRAMRFVFFEVVVEPAVGDHAGHTVKPVVDEPHDRIARWGTRL